jgi:triacylglycerol esterase/lipase EstA (alpha/beta hydrolase family)
VTVQQRARWWIGVGALCLGTLLPGLSPAGAAKLPQGTLAQGALTEVTDPGGTPSGMNVWSCRPSPGHPYPVILLHGTLFNENLSWQALSPELVNAGYCVFGFNYGSGPDSFGRIDAIGDIGTSARQLAQFVDYVRIATRTSQVDIVGHSQGGMMPRDYIKFLGGNRTVHLLIGLAPSNHGTTLDGANALLGIAQRLHLNPFTLDGCLACTEQINGMGNGFISTLNAGGDTLPGPRYVVIESRYDEVVTPYTSAFLHGPNVQNILLQDQCPLDFSDHIGIIYDPVALQDVLHALGSNNPAFTPVCSPVPPLIG